MSVSYFSKQSIISVSLGKLIIVTAMSSLDFSDFSIKILWIQFLESYNPLFFFKDKNTIFITE